MRERERDCEEMLVTFHQNDVGTQCMNSALGQSSLMPLNATHSHQLLQVEGWHNEENRDITFGANPGEANAEETRHVEYREIMGEYHSLKLIKP